MDFQWLSDKVLVFHLCGQSEDLRGGPGFVSQHHEPSHKTLPGERSWPPVRVVLQVRAGVTPRAAQGSLLLLQLQIMNCG